MGIKEILTKALAKSLTSMSDFARNTSFVARTQEIIREIAYPIPNSNRSPFLDSSVFSNLTPDRLYNILNDVKSGGDTKEYLQLAEEIELKDPHYRSVLSTRKDAVCGLEIKVIPASEDKHDIEIAECVRKDIIENNTATLHKLIRNILDALAKGFSVNEIIWKSENGKWMPSEYKFRSPSFFRYNETGERLMIRAESGSELLELTPYKFIIHEPNLISSNQAVSGLAFPALFYFMLKNYDVTSWAAFIDRFGYPIRVGKYGSKASEEDIKTLRRAVASIGSDFGAVVPESAMLEIIESKTTQSTADTYEKMATWVDKQISKLVLGQTMTSDDGSSRSQAEVHDGVRDDIANADIRQVVETINKYLTLPYVRFNFGDNVELPHIELFKPDSQNIAEVINAVSILGDKGLTVKAEEIRGMLGLSKPEAGDEIVGGRIGQTSMQNDETNSRKIEINRNAKNENDNEDDVDEIDKDYELIEDDIADVLQKVFDKSSDYETLKKELEKLAGSWNAEKVAKAMAVAFFIARAKGVEAFEDE